MVARYHHHWLTEGSSWAFWRMELMIWRVCLSFFDIGLVGRVGVRTSGE